MTNPEHKGLFAQMEEQVLDFWDRAKTFERSVAKEAPMGSYVFYDGPPLLPARRTTAISWPA